LKVNDLQSSGSAREGVQGRESGRDEAAQDAPRSAAVERPDKREPRGFPLVLIDIGPASVALEDHLASIAPEHDLKLTSPDRGGIAAAHRAGCRLVHEWPRQGIHFYL
jgi:hypothetical protein